ncbi:transposase, partial [Xanthomonas oryzae]
ASAVNSKGGFWFAVYSGGLNGELFVDLLKRMMKGRRRPIHLVLDGWPAHKTRGVRDDVDSLKGRLTLHFLPGDAPDLNPDELVWSYTKRTGVARSPLRSGEKLADRVHDQLSDIAARPELVRSFFRHPSVAYISDL